MTRNLPGLTPYTPAQNRELEPPLARRRPRRRIMAASLAALLALAVGSQSAEAAPLSRGGAVALALRQNPRVLGSRALELQARARGAQADALRHPAITATVATGPSLKAELVPGTAVDSTESVYRNLGIDDLSVVVLGQVEVTQPLYTFGKIDHRREAARREQQARAAQVEMTRGELVTAVAGLYEGLLLARDLEAFFEETERWLARTIEDTQAALASDANLTEQDVLRLQSAMSALQLGLGRARTAREQAAAGLAAFLALPTHAAPAPSEPSLELLPGELPTRARLIELAIEHRPELRALAAGSAAHRALAEAEAAGRWPDLFAYGRLSAAYTPGRDLVESRFVQDPLYHFIPLVLVGARFQITGNMAGARADEQHAQALELEQQRQWALSGIPAEVTKAFEDALGARRDAEHAQRGIDAAKQWLVRASADFSVGLGTSRDVSDAAEAYVQLRVAALDARYRHNVALAELTRATGTVEQGRGTFYPTLELTP